MKKFVVLYHAPMDEAAIAAMAAATPEQQAEGMKAWGDWAQRTGSQLVDMGAPLMNGQQINTNGAVANSVNNVSGYSVVQAENMDAAKALFKGHPHINGWNKNATIEVHEVMPIPGM